MPWSPLDRGLISTGRRLYRYSSRFPAAAATTEIKAGDSRARRSARLRRSVARISPIRKHWRRGMARKPATREGFVLFDVLYEDGSQRSNRRVPSEVLVGLDGDSPARSVIEEQDRLIAEKSGTAALAVKSIHRSGSKK